MIHLAVLLACASMGFGFETFVGLGVQGKAAELETWQAVYLNSHFDHVRPHTSLHLLSFDAPMSGTPPVGVSYLFQSNTTWTSGRNALGRSFYATERKNGPLMRYWMFADADMVSVGCKAAAAAGLSGGVDASAFCLARHLEYYLFSRLQYAQVFFLGALGSEQEHYNFDCGDAQMHAIHRAAAQVLLPYVERLEDLSWQESQAILWRVAAGCLANGGVGAGILSIKEEDKRHSPYPGGSFLSARAHVIQQIYGKKYSLSPHPIDNSTFNTVQGDCGHQPNQLAELARRPIEAPQLSLGHRTVAPPSNRNLLAVVDTQQAATTTTTNSTATATATTTATTATAAAAAAAATPVVRSLPQPTTEEAQRSAEWRQTTTFRHCHHRLASRFDQFMLGTPLEVLDGPRLGKADWARDSSPPSESKNK